MERNAVSWLSLTKATTILDHDVQRARESLGRAISKAWIVGPGGSPASAIDSNVPLRVQVTPSPGWRLVGRAWLDNPVLDWENSEIECLCMPWMSSRTSQPAPPSQSRARIEIWREDIPRLWGGPESSGDNVPLPQIDSSSQTMQQKSSMSGSSDSDPD
jgi:hypothetical protein